MLGFDRNALFTVWFTPQEWMHEASFSSGQTLGGQNTSIFKFTPPRPSKSGHEHASRAGGAPGVGPGLGNSREYRIHTYAGCIHTSRAARGRTNAAPSTRPSARRARSSPASFAAAPNRQRSSSAMRRLLVLRAIARSRRYARNPSRLCSCASRRPAAPPSRCQVVGLLAAMHPSSRASTRTTNRTRRARSDAASEA